LDHALFVGRRAVSLCELVVEVIVVRLERRRLWRALLAPAPVDVEVRQDPQQPRAQVRARLERAPAPERTSVRLLHEILCFLARPGEVTRNSEHLVAKCERLFLEAHAIARLGGDPGGIGGSLSHLGHGSTAHRSPFNASRAGAISLRCYAATISRKPARDIASSSASRVVCSSSHASV